MTTMQPCSFRALGIALVVDQLGKGPRMILRYPTAATASSPKEIPTDDPAMIHTSPGLVLEEEDLFFRLSGRQMAKLFRPKPALCGQPITLTVGGTYFCCCAVLMNESNNNENAELVEAENDPLVLFSVIVALAPLRRLTSILSPLTSPSPVAKDIVLPDVLSDKSHTSPTYQSIRQVHVTLARLCRILEREERRCRYVSCQALLFEQIRSELLSSSEGPAKSVNAATPSVSASPTSQHHRRSHSFNFDARTDFASSASSTLPSDSQPMPSSSFGAEKKQVFAQVLLETVLAAPPTKVTLNEMEITHTGNLARDFTQVYHALAVRSGNPGIGATVVRINGHIAISIASLDAASWTTLTVEPRPYQTLLFPNGPPSLRRDGNVPNHDVNLDPRQSLQEAELSPSLAADWVYRGVAVVSPVLSHHSCCVGPPNMELLRQYTLPFYQAFGGRPLWEWVRFLTVPGRTLGMARSLWQLENRFPEEEHLDGEPDLFWQMVVWMCAHGVLIPLQEYLVRLAQRSTVPSPDGDDDAEWLLTREDLWTGRISIPAARWRTGVDERRIRALVARYPSALRIVLRAPVPGDDVWDDDPAD